MPIAPGVSVPLSEIEVRVSRSSGPGGQHANVTASRVEAVFDVAASRALGEAERARITARCGPLVRATAQDTCSQARNRELAARAPALPGWQRRSPFAARAGHPTDQGVRAPAARREAAARALKRTRRPPPAE